MAVEIWKDKGFTLAMEASASGQLLTDENGSIKYINSKISDIFGYHTEELFDKPVEILIPLEHREKHPAYRKNYESEPSARKMGTGKVLYGLNKTGETIPVEIGLNPVVFDGVKYTVANVVDISERLTAQSRFEAGLEASPNGVILVKRSGEIFWINSLLEQIFGYSREELLGKNLDVLIPERFRESHNEFFSEYFKHPIAKIAGAGRDLIGLKKNGKEIPLEIALNPIEINGSVQVLASLADITERKKEEKEREALNMQIQHAQKLESLGVLAGGIAHDFNNILFGITGSLELAVLNKDNPKKFQTYIESVHSACSRALGLTRQMLFYAGKSEKHESLVFVNNTITEIVEFLSSAFTKNIEFDLSLPIEDIPVKADQSQFQQIIMNLITNAAEAIGNENGVISIRTGRVELEGEDLSAFKPSENMEPGVFVFVDVKDSGGGIFEQAKENMFDPFFTTKDSGTGLGLSVVLGIIRDHKGGILVNSESGVGTSVRVVLPYSEDELEQLGYDSKSGQDSPQVLIIDDDEINRAVLEGMMETFHLKCEMAIDGDEGLKIYFNNPAMFKIIFLDINMPGKRGTSVYKILKKSGCPSKIVLISGYNEDHIHELLKETKGDFSLAKNDIYLKKPFSLEAVREALPKELLKEHKNNVSYIKQE